METLSLIVRRYDYPPVELLLGVLTAVWGSWLLLPMPSFGATPVYRLMSGLASEEAWGLYFAAAGGASIIALAKRWRRRRLWLNRALTGGWAFVAIGAGLGSWQSTAMPVDVVLCAACVWVQGRMLLRMREMAP